MVGVHTKRWKIVVPSTRQVVKFKRVHRAKLVFDALKFTDKQLWFLKDDTTWERVV